MSDPTQRAFADEQPQAWVDSARGLADATRELVDAVGLTAVDAESLAAARADVQRLTATLRARTRPHPLRARPPARGPDGPGGSGGSDGPDGSGGPDGPDGSGGAAATRVRDFVSRPTSAFHPVLPMTYDGQRLTATWTASAAHEGPPGNLHGGVSAWHLDALLGTLANLLATPAVTATLQVRYRRPVPVGVPLDLVATPERTTDRRIVVHGMISAGGETCVEGRGVFVRLDRPTGQR